MVFLWGTVMDIFQTTPAATPRPIPMKASRTSVGRAGEGGEGEGEMGEEKGGEGGLVWDKRSERRTKGVGYVILM